eukprot:COSAG06_NODE_2362_length_7003_cov_15.069815_9_plen_87_part_00
MCCLTGVLDVLDQGVGTVVDSALELRDDMVDLFEEDSEEVHKTPFSQCQLKMLKTIILPPRQARDKRVGKVKKTGYVLSAGRPVAH